MAEITGISQLEQACKSMSNRVQRAALDAVTVGGYRIHRTAISMVSQIGTGRTYFLENPKRTHIASAPGSPPATDLGALKQSIQVDPSETATGAQCFVYSKLIYAADLELGIGVAARPWLTPAFDINHEVNLMTFKTLIGNATKGVV